MTEATKLFQEIEQNIRQKDQVLNLLQNGVEQNEDGLAEAIVLVQDYYFIPESMLINAIEKLELSFVEPSIILKIYQNALDSFYYVKIGKKLASFIISSKFQKKKGEILFEKLLSQFCWDYEQAFEFYSSYINFEQSLLNKANEKEKKQIENQIRQIHQRVIRMPIGGLEQFLQSFKEIEKDKQEQEKFDKQFHLTQEKIKTFSQIEADFKSIQTSGQQITDFFSHLNVLFEQNQIELSKVLNYYEQLIFANSAAFQIIQNHFVSFLRETANTHILSKQLKSLIKLTPQDYQLYVLYLRSQEILNKDDEEYEQAFLFVQKFVLDENLFNFSQEYIYRHCRQYLGLTEKLEEKQEMIRELFQQLSSKESYSNEQKAKVYYDLARVESFLFDQKLNARASFEKCVQLDWEKNIYWKDYYYSQVSQVIGNIQQRDRLRGILKRAVEQCKTERIEAAENWVNFEALFGQVEELIKAEEKLLGVIGQDLGIEEESQESIDEDEELEVHQKQKQKKNKSEVEQVENEKAPQVYIDSEKTVFVKHLPKDLTSDELIALVHDTGVLGCRIVKDEKQVSRGFAYIDFVTEQDAQEAVSILKNKVVKGEKLYAAISKPPKLHQDDQLTLYLENLPYSITKEKLAAKVGEGVKDIRIIYNENGQSKGYAYIEFINEETKNQNYEILSKDPFIDGRRFFVKLSDSLEKIKKNQQNHSIIIKNLPFKTRESEIEEIFDGMEINQISIPKNNEGKPKGFAFVEFKQEKHFKTALEMNGIQYKGRRLEILKSLRKITHKNEEKAERKQVENEQDAPKPRTNQDFRNLFKK